MWAEPPFASPNGWGGDLRRIVLFALICVFSATGVLAYVRHSRERLLSAQETNISVAPDGDEGLAGVRQRPHLLFRNTAAGPFYGRISAVSLEALNGDRHVTALNCERVYGSPDSGMCLQASRGVFTTYQAVYFDREFRPLHTFNLAGTPSRTRVSKSGGMAATTVFVKGDSYNAGGFSTRTSLIDLSKTRIIADLEDFTVTKDGAAFRKVDFNFWGVTFAPDGERFFATLGSGGVAYLVEGKISQRRLQVVREGVECPSISPDGTRLAFKSKTTKSGRLLWSIRVMTLSTGAETMVREDRSVDDQPEWLDADHVLYCLPRNVTGSATSDIWIARVDGSEPSRIFLSDASSPCVIRPPTAVGNTP